MATLSIPALATAEVTVNIVGATLLAKGAGVLVTVEVSCTNIPGTTTLVDLDAVVAQRAGKSINVGCNNLGIEDTAITCDGTTQTFDVTIVSGCDGPSGPFKKGLAIVDAFAVICSDSAPCEEGSSPSEEIRLR